MPLTRLRRGAVFRFCTRERSQRDHDFAVDVASGL